MLCVILNSAALAGAGALMAAAWRGTAMEDEKSPTRTLAKNQKVRSFTVGK
jgi:hypothetical protein